MERLDWQAGAETREFASLKGSDMRKVAIARLIRKRTAVSLGWIAEHLFMRSATNVSQQIGRKRDMEREVPKPLKEWIKQS